jgi:hypothetical protein
MGLRLATLSVLVAVLYAFRYRRDFLQRSAVPRAAILAILGSVVMGIDYVLFQLPEILWGAGWNGSFTVHHGYGAIAAVVFIISQLAAAADLSRGDRGFMKWLLPPILYLFAIGIWGGIAFGNPDQFRADTGRAILLLGLGLAARRRI